MMPDNAQPDLSEEQAKKLGISLEDYLLPTHGKIQMISETGELLSVEEQGSTPGHEYPMPTQEQLLEGYRQLVIGRRVNDQNYALVRQGRMAVYPSSHGQEASEVRSEEHTSELQSRGHLVCRLLLEKKKKILRTKWTH